MAMWTDYPGICTASAWTYWTSASTEASSAVTSGAEESWVSWCVPTDTTATLTWDHWTGGTAAYQVYRAVKTVPLTPEQLTAQEEDRKQWEAEDAKRREEYRKRAEAQEKALQDAGRKAKELLEKMLDDTQLKEFAATKTFHVKGGKSGVVYRIKCGLQHNVDIVEGGKIVANLCGYVQPPDSSQYVPAEDNMLAQKLLLEHPETEDVFLRAANRTPRLPVAA